MFITMCLLLLGFCGVSARLFFLQVAKGAEYRKEAESQRTITIDLPAKRGQILDRNGDVLADSLEADTVYADPFLIKDPKKAAVLIAPILSMPQEKIEQRLSQNAGFVYLARRVDPRTATRLKKAIKEFNKKEKLEDRIDGVGFLPETKRVYPLNSVASQVIGFTNIDDQGRAGIELYYDDILKGKPGVMVSERDCVLGCDIPGGKSKQKPPVDGSNIQLTIDKDIQYKVQVELEKTAKDFKAISASAIVMNPTNGEIYAMASAPTFSPNDDTIADPQRTRNRTISDTYEPGSTMKIFTVAGALEENLYSPNDSLYLPATIKVGGRTIRESHARAAKNMTIAEIMQESSNVGAVTIGQRLGKEKLVEYIDRFALTKPTGIDLPGEAVGYMPPLSQWSASTIGNIPFGQGIVVTPLGILRGLSVMANDGVLPDPHLLMKKSPEGDLSKKAGKSKAEQAKRSVSPETTGEMREILEKVVTAGTGSGAKVEGYRVAGKTGTAQKPKPGVGYASGAYIGSFMGYVPSRNPQLAIIVAVDEPQGDIYGGTVAAPVFSRIAEYSLRHLKIAP